MPRSNREELLRATIDVIAARGVHGLRVEDVANAVGVTKSLAYYHFGSKAGLLAATLDYNEGLAPNSNIQPAESTALERLVSAANAEFEDSEVVRVNQVVWHDINAAASFDDELRERVRAMTNRWVSDIAQLVEQGRHDGSVRANVDPEAAATTYTALLAGLIERVLIDEGRRDEARRCVLAWLLDSLSAGSRLPA